MSKRLGQYVTDLLIQRVQAAGGRRTIHKGVADLRTLYYLEEACRQGKIERVSEDLWTVTYRLPDASKGEWRYV